MITSGGLSKIFLVGLPGSGKSTVGKSLASLIKRPFVDLDQEIEKEDQRPVHEIFQARGENYFRQIESDILKRWCEKSDSFVMATGGGAPCFHENMSLMNQTGTTIFLDVAASEISARMARSNLQERPLLAGLSRDQMKDKIEFLRTHRLPFYKQASLTISGQTISAQDVLAYLKWESQRD